ncbi:MAG TPA: MarR family transcriptional regulator [Gaiellaceae bacterium]|nr:MarR family transcriptional regulator [Gaiellaceae bacterium]
MSASSADHSDARRILGELSRLIRHLTRVTGGPDEGPSMTSTQRLALFELAESGPLRLNDLAERMGTSPPTASRAVDALVELGLVERVTDPADRRAVRIDVTDAGRARFDDRQARVTDAVAPALAALTRAERQQLADLLARLRQRLEP